MKRDGTRAYLSTSDYSSWIIQSCVSTARRSHTCEWTPAPPKSAQKGWARSGAPRREWRRYQIHVSYQSFFEFEP